MFQYVLAHPRHGYALAVLTLVFLLSNIDDSLYGADRAPFISNSEFDQLGGPLITVPFTFGSVIVSIAANKLNKVYVLTVALVVWSAATAGAGFTTSFTQLALVRVAQGVAGGACAPFSISMISAYFPGHLKATATSIFNVGIYAGFSIAQSVGTSLTDASGRWWVPYSLFGGIGVVMAILLCATVKEPKPQPAQRLSLQLDGEDDESVEPNLVPAGPVEILKYWLTSPSLLLLCIASGLKFLGGITWSYQMKTWFVKTMHVADATYSVYILWIPLLGGSLGSILGGFISDNLVNRRWSDGSKMGAQGRLLLIIVSLVVSSPFAAGALWFKHPVPWGFLTMIPAAVLGEMWIAVVVTICVELTPRSMHAATVSIFMFISVNIGGCGPSLVTPMQNAFGGAHSLQSTLLALYPGTYLIAVAVFVFAFGFLPRDMRRVEEYYRKGSAGNGGLGVALLLPSEELEYEEGVDVVVGVPVDEGDAGLVRG